MIVLGIDQGMANLGYAIIDIDDGVVNILKSGVVTTTARINYGKRLLKIREEIEKLMAKYKPSIIGCEKLFYNAPTGGRNKSLAMMQVNMVTGLLHVVSTENNIPIKECSPPTVKKFITGNGRATKEDMYAGIAPYLTKVVKAEHEIDAIAIGITAYYKKEEDDGIAEK